MAHVHEVEQGFDLGVQVSSSRCPLEGASHVRWSNVITNLEIRDCKHKESTLLHPFCQLPKMMLQ